MTQAVIRVVDGLHQVGLTERGIDWQPVVDAAYAKPRKAIDHAARLNGETPTPRRAPDPDLARTLGGGPASRDEDPAPAEAPDGPVRASVTDPVALPPGAAGVGTTTSAGTPDPAPDTAGRYPAGVQVCAGCGGRPPLGRRGQRRLTCSPACRVAASRKRSAKKPGRADTRGGVTPSRPQRASDAVTVRTSSGAAVSSPGGTIPAAPLGARADLPGADPGPISLGL